MAQNGVFDSIVQIVTGGLVNGSADQGAIGKFLAKMNTGGVAYHHLFYVSIFNNAIQSVNGTDSESLRLFCNSASIPALNIMSSPYRENEASFEVPYGISYEPVTMNFYADRKMKIKGLFDNWHGQIANSRTGATGSSNDNRFEFMDQFTTDIKITVLGKDMDPVYNLSLIDAWPKSIGNIDMNFANTDIINFPVQFVYKRIEIEQLFEEYLPNNVRPRTSASFPVSIWDSAKSIAGEIMQSVDSAVESVQGAVKTVLGGPAQLQDVAANTARQRVTDELVPTVHYVND